MASPITTIQAELRERERLYTAAVVALALNTSVEKVEAARQAGPLRAYTVESRFHLYDDESVARWDSGQDHMWADRHRAHGWEQVKPIVERYRYRLNMARAVVLAGDDALAASQRRADEYM